MKLIKADNYQTWYIEEKNKSIIIDPWLTNSLQPDKSFFIQRKKKIATCLTNSELKKIGAIIITAPFEDHLHVESIKFFDIKVPIYTSKIVKRFLLNRNIQNPIFILNEQGTEICGMNVKSLPTSYPYYKSTFSILIEDKNRNKIFHEGHVVNFRYIKKNKIKADVAILTADNVKLFGLISLGMISSKTLTACSLLESENLFITGNKPQDTTGLISNFLKIDNYEFDEISKSIKTYANSGDCLELN